MKFFHFKEPFSNLQKITCIILRNLFGLDLFSHQSCATGTLLLQKKIYPRKSSPNLKQVIFFTLLRQIKKLIQEPEQPKRDSCSVTCLNAVYGKETVRNVGYLREIL